MLFSRMSKLGVGALGVLWGISACGGDAEIASSKKDFGPGNPSGGSGGATSTGGTGGTGIIIPPDGGATGGTGGSISDPCATVNCPETGRCEVTDGVGSCVPNTCGDLTCSGTEICEVTPDGAFCKDISCSQPTDCPDEAQFCDTSTGVCTDDICVPATPRCDGETLLICDSFGGEEASPFACESGSPYYNSTCSEATGSGACTCEDDWDCASDTRCEAGVCEGTGVAPTCSLPPADFADVPPTNEITWGGTGIGAEDAPVTTPFRSSAQVVLTPIVANLDDDNGDGLIDERDFPEIIFTTFTSHDFTSNGTLRAIHGGGANKGADFFANCAGNYWFEGDDPTAVSCSQSAADLDSTASLAVGDLDYDGVPEIVAITEGDNVRIYSNLGEIIATSSVSGLGGGNPAPTLANLDNSGHAEIVVGRDVFTLQTDSGGQLAFLDHFEGSGDTGTNGQGPVSCVANIAGDSRQEIVAGTTAYRYPVAPAAALSQADCTGSETDSDEIAWCNGQLPELWDASGSNGFCSIADVWGADPLVAPGPANPLDGVPEVVLVRDGNIDVINSADGSRITSFSFGAGTRGGPPNIDDFDGDGFPEVGTAGSTAYVLTDFQDVSVACPAWPSVNDDQTSTPRTAPATTCTTDADCGDNTQFACNETIGSCVCLHNGWRRSTQDDSSQVTGSSVFDFNGDGAAEVVYNDECFFRVYDGTNGGQLFAFPSESRTRIEYPIVADVDNDGNAEIVFATTNESGFCNGADRQAGEYNNGIEVWGDSSDLWVSARRIWNQHAYHITNVTEGGVIPRFEPESWGSYNGRVYNSYRSNPRNFGVAPDLVVEAVQVTSQDAGCGVLGSEVNITVQISNIGDLRVGPGVVVTFEGTWNTPPLTEALLDGGGQPLTATIQNSLEPGATLLLTVAYDAANNTPGTLPDLVTARVDEGNAERECVESNNEASTPVEGAQDLADLRIELGAVSVVTCPNPEVPTVVFNDGTAAVSDVVVRYYQGDPAAGGAVLHEVVRPGPIAAGGMDAFTAAMPSFPLNANVLIYGVVDPDNVIPECNDGNNADTADNKVTCGSVQ